MLALELPTGGLADALGRRPVLLLGGLIGIASARAVRLGADRARVRAGRGLAGGLSGARFGADGGLVRRCRARRGCHHSGGSGPVPGRDGGRPGDRPRRADLRRSRRLAPDRQPESAAAALLDRHRAEPGAPGGVRAARPRAAAGRRFTRAGRVVLGARGAAGDPGRRTTAGHGADTALPGPGRIVLERRHDRVRDPQHGPARRAGRRRRARRRPDRAGVVGLLGSVRRRSPGGWSGQPPDRGRLGGAAGSAC